MMWIKKSPKIRLNTQEKLKEKIKLSKANKTFHNSENQQNSASRQTALIPNSIYCTDITNVMATVPTRQQPTCWHKGHVKRTNARSSKFGVFQSFDKYLVSN